MTISHNQVVLIGNLGRDPEIRALQNGGRVCSFSVACSERWTDRSSGEKMEKTEWVNVVVWPDYLISDLERTAKKGASVTVIGKLQTRKWVDNSGAERWTTEVVVQGGGTNVVVAAQVPRQQQNGGYDQHGGYDQAPQQRAPQGQQRAPQGQQRAPQGQQRGGYDQAPQQRAPQGQQRGGYVPPANDLDDDIPF